MTGTGKAMLAEAKGISLWNWDRNRHKIELVDILYIPDFKKMIISLSKLLDQGYKMDKWTKKYFWLTKDAARMQQCKNGTTSKSKTYKHSGAYNGYKWGAQQEAHMGEDIVCKTIAQLS